MPVLENPHAGTGSVVLDIGGDVGALIVTMPASMDEVEVEIVPTGTAALHRSAEDAQSAGHSHADGHSHANGHTHDGHSAAAHRPHPGHADLTDPDQRHANSGAPPHVAVVPRPTPDGAIIYSLVFGQLREGIYDLYVRPAGPVQLTAVVIGGRITEALWPR